MQFYLFNILPKLHHRKCVTLPVNRRNVHTFSLLCILSDNNMIKRNLHENRSVQTLQHLCSYSTFQFSAFAQLFHQGLSGPIANSDWTLISCF